MHVADPLRISMFAAAAGILASWISGWRMRCGCLQRSAASILTAFTLLPFGGAARSTGGGRGELGMTRILVPPRPGAFSALGLICTDVVHDYMRSGA